MRTPLFIALAAASFTVAAAQPLLPAGARDQTPGRLVALPVPAVQAERAPVSFAWKLDPAQSLKAPTSYVAESREYWKTVDAAELREGVALKTSAPGSLVRISPVQGARALRSDEVQVFSNGRAAKLQSIANADQLRKAGMDVNDGTVVAKFAESSASTYRLKADTAQGQYLVHVFEPQSSDVLRASLSSDHALAGGTLQLQVGFSRSAKSAAAPRAEALLVAPDGRNWPVTMRAGNGGLTADVKLPANVGNTRGLWELQVFAETDGIARDTRTAFAVGAPTARFKGNAAFNAKTMRYALPVVAGSEGRYEARGTLYATAPDGLMRPVSQAHSATWMKRGNGMLVLQFEKAHLPAGYGAPYEIRQLELHDQTRMAPLEVRERGGVVR